ncbi:hypothetical protein Rhe02_91990 [Rhizocola hellebori]|uniref:DUF2269 domain-containing protein n=1 Tax=Rhizocola hellebori TaxID=1392758 RepID=A0A8J3QJC4_9ACTN|nr:hypothetical protein [Rhizocola hellebori]GIH11132.1 hypothetical protein Rhe02_91990 [Rhizocola hellebori]
MRKRLTPRWRKALLTVHIVTSVGWLGISAVLLTLGVAGARGADPELVYPAMGLIGTALLTPLVVVAWVFGLLSSLLTPWGVFKHWWVTVKLVATTILTVLVLFVLGPTLRLAATGAALGPEAREQLLAAPIVQTVALIVITVLSTYKPWGRLSRKPVVRGSAARRELAVTRR